MQKINGDIIMNRIADAFTAHPASVDETYYEHFLFAMKFSALLFAAAFAALVHAVLPFLFENTASNMIRHLYARIEHRGVSAPAAVPAE